MPSEDFKIRELRQKGLRLAGLSDDEIDEIPGALSRGVLGDPNHWLSEEDIAFIMSTMPTRPKEDGMTAAEEDTWQTRAGSTSAQAR